MYWRKDDNMPKIKDAKNLDYERKNTISMRIDPYLLSHFTEKAGKKPGSRTKEMERSMRVGEQFHETIHEVEMLFAKNPDLAAEYADPNGTHWSADGSRMTVVDAMTIGYILDAVKTRIENDAGDRAKPV